MTIPSAALVLAVLMTSLAAHAAKFTVNVVDSAGLPVTGFRWILEEDNSHAVTPGVIIDRAGVPTANLDTPNNRAVSDTSLAFDFHASHSPVAFKANNGQGLTGDSTGSSALVTNVRGNANNQRRYFISVLPYEGYSLGGAQVLIDETGLQSEQVTVVVRAYPLRTAQVSVFVFHDNAPLNNAPDLPAETGLGGADWNVMVFDAGGLYGIAGGRVLQDAFGNPLGTVYAPGDPNTVLVMGDGTIHPDPVTGVVVIQNLFPGKYGIQVTPPAGAGWIQTATIEGTKTVDAWVKANEPRFFMEFGPPGHHVFIGYVQKVYNDPIALSGGASIKGQVTNTHVSRPPAVSFFSAEPFPACVIGLNELAAVGGKVLHVQACDANSEFQIDNVPAGNYQLVIFDENLDIVIAQLGVTVDAGAATCNLGRSCDLAEVPVFNWFGKMDGWGFFDANANGYWDVGEPNMPPLSTLLNLRFRNGQLYQSLAVDGEGNAPFDEVFPFFHWLVAEWDFATLKATGATFTSDAGGPVQLGEITNPQPNTAAPTCGGIFGPEECTVDGISTTLVGPALTAGFQLFLGQANVIEWGKGVYGADENGGISGLVVNTVTRAENDPRFAVVEPWETLVPRVQVALYEDSLDNVTGLPLLGGDGVADDTNASGALEYADVDNYPLGWSDPACVNNPSITGNECLKSPEDVDHNANGAYDAGDAIDITWSDSWDDNKPTGCLGNNGVGFLDLDCFDGIRSFNQVRPAVFDGGYAFGPRYDCSPDLVGGCAEGSYLARGADGFGYLRAGQYIVQGSPPPGYEIAKEEDRNVDFGDEVIPLLLPAACVGDLREIPLYMSMSTNAAGTVVVSAPEPAPFAGDQIPGSGDERPLCDRKSVNLSSGQNAATDFHLMTRTPKAARVVGFILDDTSNEFSPLSPNFGEKWSPSWMPVSFRDWTGEEIARTYADEFGRYNALLPSTYTANVPMPSGMSPNMLTACMNSANPIANPDFGVVADAPEFITDPFHDAKYSQFCYTFQYMPGSTTYLDTPVVPTAAFAGGGQFPVDCEYNTGTPLIASVQRRIADGGGGPFVLAGQQLIIRSAGKVMVVNPAYDGTNATPRTIQRDYRFGKTANAGTVTLVAKDGTSYPLDVWPAGGAIASQGWKQRRIRAIVPATVPVDTYQLVVTRGNGNVSPIGVTVSVGFQDTAIVAGVPVFVERAPSGGLVHNVALDGSAAFTTIQAGIDAASPGDLVMVAPGFYEEMVIMYKPIALQGWGAGAVIINGVSAPAEKLQNWRDTMAALLGVVTGNVQTGLEGLNFDLLPGQNQGFNVMDNEPDLFTTGEGPVITVVAHKGDIKPNSFNALADPRIDGFTLTGSAGAGGVYVNGYGDWLQISNNRIASNAGWHGGGIRSGHTNLQVQTFQGTVDVDAQNDNLWIHHNQIMQNGSIGGIGGAGGGVALYNGSDNYKVTDNLICGNFSLADGAGIGHRGLSDNGLIEHNQIIFNQSFNQGRSVSGGGIFIGGSPAGIGAAGFGTGSVDIIDNIIQGNQAGAGDGGGIRTQFVNGRDVVVPCTAQDVFLQLYSCNSTTEFRDETAWYHIDIFNNTIANNVAGLAGAGISLQDTVNVRIANNTIAHNDSTSTAGEAFAPGSPTLSSPQTAGVVLRVHSGTLLANLALTDAPNLPAWTQAAYSQPHLFDNNIIWHNRSFFFLVDPTTDPNTSGLCPSVGIGSVSCPGGSAPVYSDLAVLGTASTGLVPKFTVFSETYAGPGAADATNLLSLDPGFINGFTNGNRGQTINMVEAATPLMAQPAFDEGGNFIDVRFGPLTLFTNIAIDYHLDAGSVAIGIADAKADPALQTDIDGDLRTVPWDTGSDER